VAISARWTTPVLFAICCSAGAQSGGPFEISRSAISGGGKASGGVYEIVGAVAQPDASPPAGLGDEFELRGGLYASPVTEIDEALFIDGFESGQSGKNRQTRNLSDRM